jgi:hypothetical protein
MANGRYMRKVDGVLLTTMVIAAMLRSAPSSLATKVKLSMPLNPRSGM